jgi:transmembrane sensor
MEERIEYIINQFLEREATSSEKTELSSWLKESEENEKLFLSYYSAWDISMQVEFNPKVAIKKMHQLIQKRHLEKEIDMHSHSHKHYIIYISSIAASLLLIVGLYFFYITNQSYKNIRDIAAQMSGISNKTNDIQLFLTKDQYITLKGKTVNIAYHDERANIDNKTIGIKGSPYNELIVPDGHKGMLALEDGTKIWIKAGTSMLYPTHFTREKIRQVYVDGEIYIEVAHNKDLPFIVNTKNLNVRVTGTKFDVIVYPDEKTSKVILERGSVNVSRVKEKEDMARKLSPGQMYDLSANNKESIQNVDVSKYISWVNDIYDCEDETLRQVSSDLGRLYGKHIVCSESIADLPCCGKLDLQEDLPSLLTNITEVLSIHYHVKNGVYYLSR